MLNFLRDGELNLPDNPRETQQLRREAEFYQIVPMIKALESWASSSSSFVSEKTALSYRNGWFVEVEDGRIDMGARMLGSVTFFP